MAHRIRDVRLALEPLGGLSARDRATVLDAVDDQLTTGNLN